SNAGTAESPPFPIFLAGCVHLAQPSSAWLKVIGMAAREILVGVCGGVAAYKTADLVSKLVQSGIKVSVIMTEAATRFIGQTTFEALTGRPVYIDMFSPNEHFLGEHIGLARRAQLFVAAPATADTMAKLAHG